MQTSKKMARKMACQRDDDSLKGPATVALERSLKRRRLSIDDISSTSSSSSSSEEGPVLRGMDELFRFIIDFPVIQWVEDEADDNAGLPAIDDFFAVVG